MTAHIFHGLAILVLGSAQYWESFLNLFVGADSPAAIGNDHVPRRENVLALQAMCQQKMGMIASGFYTNGNVPAKVDAFMKNPCRLTAEDQRQPSLKVPFNERQLPVAAPKDRSVLWRKGKDYGHNLKASLAFCAERARQGDARLASEKHLLVKLVWFALAHHLILLSLHRCFVYLVLYLYVHLLDDVATFDEHLFDTGSKVGIHTGPAFLGKASKRLPMWHKSLGLLPDLLALLEMQQQEREGLQDQAFAFKGSEERVLTLVELFAVVFMNCRMVLVRSIVVWLCRASSVGF